MERKKLSKNSKKPVALSFKFSDLFSADYRIVTVLLVILPLLIYAQVYDFAFVWDDEGYETKAGHIKNSFVQNPSWASFTQLFTQPFFSMYIPISYLFWSLLKSIAELLSLPFNSVLHLSNVVLHIINGLLVFTILKQFIVNKWAVLVGVGFFLLHPIQVEAVAFVSEFRVLLATLFVLLSLYYYLKKSAKLSYLALVFFVLAVLSKPSAVVLVAFVFIINYFYYGFKLGKNIQKTLPFALIALVFVLIASSVQFSNRTDLAEFTLTFWQRPFAWLDSIVFYLYKIIYPYHLSLSYALSPKFISVQWWFYTLALVPLALGYLLWLRRKTQPLLIFAVALFVAGFFTTSGFVSFAFQKSSLVADRYVYFAMIGIALLIGIIFNKVEKKVWQSLIISILIVFASLSAFRQIPLWQNKLKLWSHSMNYEATSGYAHGNLAVYFSIKAKAFYNTGEYNQAITYFDKAIKLYPKDSIDKLSTTTYNKGLALLHLKKYQQAIDYFDQANKISPNYAYTDDSGDGALHNKGFALLHLKKYQQALEHFNQAIKINPTNANPHNGKIHLLASLKQCKKAKQAATFARQHKVKLHESTTKNLHKFCP